MTSSMTAPEKHYWLGVPDGRTGMVELPSVNAGTQANMTRGDQEHDLISGGIANMHAPLLKRQWGFQRDWLTQDENEILTGFYSGAYDSGPFRLYDPGEVNMLGQDASTFGRFTNDLSWWNPSGLVAAVDDTELTRPDAVTTQASRVVKLTDLSATDSYGGYAGLDSYLKVPRIPNVGLQYTWSMWMKASAAGLQAFLWVADDTLSHFENGAPFNPTTGWTRHNVVATDSTFSGKYLISGITINTAAGQSLSLCAPQLEIGSAVSNYHIGMGIAPVVFGSQGITRVTPRTKWRSPSWQLVEI